MRIIEHIPTQSRAIKMAKISVNNGTVTKSIEITDDPKRAGLLIGRCFDENDRLLATLYGKKNQQELRCFKGETR
tara:strand:- start:342 stop:566 length:225 start_codon:yes stop_codon:yes gene_type:complete